MKLDCHFYGVLAFCRAVGFDKESAHTVAYASQFVDDAKANQIILREEPEIQLKTTDLSDGPSFINMATCHNYKNLDTFNFDAMMNNTAAFHFVPGCEGNNFPRKLRCKKESPIIMNILEDVKEEGDLIKLGIALHVYADTFSHQGFAGLLSKVNDIKEPKEHIDISNRGFNLLNNLNKLFDDKFDDPSDRVVPAYGHGQVYTYPDIPFLEWEYKYDHSDYFTKEYESDGIIDNKERFKEGFVKIKEYLQEFLKVNSEFKEDNNFDDYDTLFDTLKKEGTEEERIGYWKEVYDQVDLFDEEESELFTYDKDLWLENAFEDFHYKNYHQRLVEDASITDNFKDSNWYKYYLSVDWYKEKFYKYCTENNLEIPYQNL